MKWLAGLIRRLAEPAPSVKFISWYQEPRAYRPRTFLCYNEGSDHSPSMRGYWYSPDQGLAKRFDTREEAEAVTPCYDGSGGIEKRTGVMAVYS
ncbi:hypothetical protein [Sphingopyxis flava]|uniref:Uncharacterized protein n=1 Tax=Sphingopyxis flava TaxID=1507287 RepID=A0A1T5CUW9_9SPHN|nr:hypothetical protein [Sphingopyxis flava]SKB63295.1 hypothetical protein SAMN06295937_1011144 [Sphingopyxis flava]